MRNKFIKLTIAVFAILGLTAPITTPTFAAPQDICTNDQIPNEIKKANGCPGAVGDQFPTVIENILEAIIGIAGLVAVVFIVIGGVTYMTSAGDAGKVKKAKDTILYACIGLVVCALAFAITNWAIGIVNNSDAPAADPADSTTQNVEQDADQTENDSTPGGTSYIVPKNSIAFLEKTV